MTFQAATFRRHARAGLGDLLLLLPLLVGVSACAPTLQQRYINADDPCSMKRQPIVSAGDELDRRQKAIADAYARQQMQGHELPVVTQNGSRIQFSLGNALQNAVHEAVLQQQAYAAIKAQENGSNAAAMLVSMQGDAQSQTTSVRAVSTAMRELRQCRRTQITQISSAVSTGTLNEADGRSKLLLQQRELERDDELIRGVFGQFGARADMIASATSAVAPGGATARPLPRPQPSPQSQPTQTPRVASPPPATPKSVSASVDSMKSTQATAVANDNKDSATVHQALQSALASMQERTERLAPVRVAAWQDINGAGEPVLPGRL
jgi:hypothetical protein